MSKQIRLRRAQDKCFQRTTDATEADLIPLVTNVNLNAQEIDASEQLIYSSLPSDNICAQVSSSSAGVSAQMLDTKNMCYFCQKCKNHGSVVYKKNHKRQCPYIECTCDSCDLIEIRRKLDQNIKRKKASQKGSADSIPSIRSSNNTEFPFSTSSSAPAINFGMTSNEGSASANVSLQLFENHSSPSDSSCFDVENVSSLSPNHIHTLSPSFLNIAALGSNSGLISSSLSPVSSNPECCANNFLQTKGFPTLFPMGNFGLDNKPVAFAPNFSPSSSTPSPMSSFSSISQFMAPMTADDGVLHKKSCGMFEPSIGTNQLLNSNDYFKSCQQFACLFASLVSQQQQLGTEKQMKNMQAFASVKQTVPKCFDVTDHEKMEICLGNTPVTPPSPAISQEIVQDKLLQQLLKKPQVEQPHQGETNRLSFKEIDNLMIYDAIAKQQAHHQ